MKNIFSPVRFGRLAVKYVCDNRRQLLLSGLFVTAVMLLIALINGISYMYSKLSGVDEEIGFMLLAFVANGYIIASTAFKGMGDGKGAVSMLMTPVSALEQCLVRWIAVVPGYIVWALLSAAFADWVKYLVCNYMFGGNVEMIPWGRIFEFSSSLAVFNLYMVLLTFIFTQSFFFLGAIVWRKHNFIKTFYVVAMLVLVYSVVLAIVADSYISASRLNLFVHVDEREYLMYLPMQIMLWLGTLINYTLTVMRFKEAEVIHRW